MQTKSTISPRSVEVYEFIKVFRKDNKYSPTIQEIADGIDACVSVVNYCLMLLERHGYITRKPRKSRSILLVEK